MLTTSDLLHLPYTPDLTEGGIAYALHALPSMHRRADCPPFDQLRRVVAATVVELAFRRHLTEQGIPFEVKGAAPFTEPDHYAVALGGRRCAIKSFLISYRSQIAEMRRDPRLVLRAPALVASDQHAGSGYAGQDLYLFAFLPALVTASQNDLQKVIETKQPHYLVHVMPEAWKRPPTWSPLGSLVLKSEATESVTIEIGGQAEGRERRSCLLELPPQTRIEIETDLFSLSYVHAKSKPKSRIGIHSLLRKETHMMSPPDWGNIWVYGMDVLLVGYIAREEFSRRASFIQAGAHVFQYDQTHVKNLALPMSELKPLSELFERVKSSLPQWTA